MRYNNRFKELKSKYFGIYNYVIDREVDSMLYIFSENDSLYQKVEQIVDFENRSIKPSILESSILSSSEKALIRLAFNLFNGYCNESNSVYFTPSLIFWNLDSINTEIAINALRIRYQHL